MITFNKPYLTGKELDYIQQAANHRKLSGNGIFTQKCQNFFSEKFGFEKCLLTTSCTDALEMIAILINIQPGDEIIMPSYTFVSCANAFVLRGAKIRFVDCKLDHPNIDPNQILPLINSKTKAILVMHYAGVACDMESFEKICQAHNLYLIEDAAQAINAFYEDRPLGSFGHFATFSFHETKNIQAGEGGMLVINDTTFIDRAEIIWEKGTNRSAFARGEISKYTWIDVGSSFLPSEIIAAFLWAQLEQLDEIHQKRMECWCFYQEVLMPLVEKSFFEIPEISPLAQHNGHIFYLICKSQQERNDLIQYLKHKNIQAIFHYLPLHQSPFYLHSSSETIQLPHCEKFADCLIRLPLYVELTRQEQEYIVEAIKDFFYSKKIS